MKQILIYIQRVSGTQKSARVIGESVAVVNNHNKVAFEATSKSETTSLIFISAINL